MNIRTIALALMTLAASAAAQQSSDLRIDEAKTAVLLQFQDSLETRAASEDVLLPAADEQVEEGVEDKGDGLNERTISDQGFTFKGTGGFGLRVSIDKTPSRSYIGYVVTSGSSSCQDMLILEDLRDLGRGTKTIGAACTDLHKSFPYEDLSMGSTPWTSDSTAHWAYWARKAVLKGVELNYSFDEIQSSVWYITDREGSYSDHRLLRAIGYSSSSPSKHSSSTNTTNYINNDSSDYYSSGLCGTGYFLMIPFLMVGLAAMKVSYRRPR